MKSLSVILSVLLTACVSNPQGIKPPQPELQVKSNPPLLETSPFGEKLTLISTKELFALSQQQKQEFFNFYNRPSLQHLYPNRRVSQFLKQKLQNFGFFSDTLTASQGMQSEQGNCLSLAILTNAMAKLAGVKVGFHLVATPPIFQKENDIVLSSQHVKSLLYDPMPTNSDGYFVLFRGKVTIDYFPVDGTRTLREVQEDEFHAMYYRNRAAESYVKNDFNLAYWNAVEALKLHHNDAQALNMIAILYEKANRTQQAEKIYTYGLQHADEKFELLHNYHLFLLNQGRDNEAKVIDKQLAKYDQPDPFKWVSLAESEYQAGDYDKAIHFYRKALKIADYLHEPYFGIARAETLKGNFVRAKKAMKKAIDNAHKKKTVSIYEAKYNALSNLLAHNN